MTELRHYRREDGTYIGAFNTEQTEDGFIECPAPPDGLAIWVDGAWSMEAILSANARARRNELLSESDWTQVADAPVDKVAWAVYRQNLRDITAQSGFPHNVAWPIKPEEIA